jgi:sterol desaturase/sphingolipid hydroxylase (fatty acid hydroxylase superfamily)
MKWMNIWLNLFRRTPPEYFADFFITAPITLTLLCFSLANADTYWPFSFAAGLLIWTFYEYIAHRFVAHGVPLFKEAHQLHHDHQRDYIALHPVMTLALYGAFWMLFGFGSSAISVGFSVGYLIYATMHTAFHYAVIDPGNIFYGPKMRHVIHHRVDANFGVTTSLWDRVFKTEYIIKLK